MILELADIRIHPGQNAAFDEAISRGLRDVISQAKGFQGFKVNKGIENPDRYVLQIFWLRSKTIRWISANRTCSRSGGRSLGHFCCASGGGAL